MTAFEELRARIAAVEDLRSVVRTLKALAAVQMRQYQSVARSLVDQARTIELGFQAALRGRDVAGLGGSSRHGSRIAAIVFGSDQGMCGSFDEEVVEFAREQLAPKREAPALVVVGARVAERLASSGFALDAELSLPSSLAGVVDLVGELLEHADAWNASPRIERVLVIHQRRKLGAPSRPRRFQLAPIPARWLRSLAQRPWPARGLPIHTLDDERLLGALGLTFFGGSLYRAAVESLEAENAARLAAMRAAERNIDERLDELQALLREERQSAITAELFDIVVGSEAVAQRP